MEGLPACEACWGTLTSNETLGDGAMVRFRWLKALWERWHPTRTLVDRAKARFPRLIAQGKDASSPWTEILTWFWRVPKDAVYEPPIMNKAHMEQFERLRLIVVARCMDQPVASCGAPAWAAKKPWLLVSHLYSSIMQIPEIRWLRIGMPLAQN